MKIIGNVSALMLWCVVAWATPAHAATTYYVRIGGGTTTQCTGTTNADYPGAGMGQACAYHDLQAALNAATFGDTIKLRAGQTWSNAVFTSFYLGNKGTPPTGTDADYITITTDDPAGTPAALAGYPASPTRITAAMAATMPKVQSVWGGPVFEFLPSSKYWKIERLNITNVDAGCCGDTIMLVANNDYAITAKSQYPDHIVLQLNWFHPIEETGAPLDAGNLSRTAENAIYLNATNVTVRQNAFQGFVGRNKYGSDAGQPMTSSNYLITAWADNVLIEHNLLEAWTYAFFSGGSSVPGHLVTRSATVSACDAISCTFSNTTGLAAGDPIGIRVAASPTDWGGAFVRSIAGNRVTFTAPLCATNGNDCVGIGAPVPVDGAVVRWDGDQPQHIMLRRNIFAHYAEWTALSGGICGGKGYSEIKAGKNVTFDGNIFVGCTGMALTVRNQSGDFPWATLDGLTISNNYFKNSNGFPGGWFADFSNPTRKSKNVTVTNNLLVGLSTNEWTPSGLLGSLVGAENPVVTHNTVVYSHFYQGFTGWWQSTNGLMSATAEGLTLRDNIFGISNNLCFNAAGAPATVGNPCWPAAAIDHNLLVNVNGHPSTDVSAWWLTPYPNNTVVESYAAIGFTNLAAAEAGGDYHGYALAASSPFKSRASDGKDPGVDFAALDAAILGTEPTPVPSPSAGPLVATNDGVSEKNVAGPSSTPAPGGAADLRIRLSGLRAAPTAVDITGPGGNHWTYNSPGGWAIVMEPVVGDPTRAACYFEPAAPSGTTGPFTVRVTYPDGSADEVQALTAPAPPPSPTLEERIAQLEAELAALRATVAAADLPGVQQRLQSLELRVMQVFQALADANLPGAEARLRAIEAWLEAAPRPMKTAP